MAAATFDVTPKSWTLNLDVNNKSLYYSSELGIWPGSFLLTSVLFFYCYITKYISSVYVQNVRRIQSDSRIVIYSSSVQRNSPS